MAFHVEIAPRALADLEAAFQFIRKDSPERAAQWLLGIIDAVNSLEEMPARCPLAPESEDLGEEVRVLHFGRRQHVYRVFLSVRFTGRNRGAVRVFHVRHGARRPPSPTELEQSIG
ncbi:MAG: type II toxin-antitoxin system RelE/ParE family toxin [Acidobacteria bacterium]|nr:type II toxin-antitoxin system RelE/ParE family toxin [Acidobacteriota bacterium]